MKDSTTNKYLISAVLLCICLSVFTFAKIDYNPAVACYYNSSGRIGTGSKVWIGRVAITSASGQSVDISSAGF